MRGIVVAAAVLLAGCQSLLGLDETHVGALVDAPSDLDAAIDGQPEIDAPPACTALIDCTPVAGRALCGQIYGSGLEAGPLRAANPTGATCGAGETTGPCNLTLKVGRAEDFASYGMDPTAFDSSSLTATVDDCGRFSVLNLPATADDLVVVTTGNADTRPTATLYTGREAEAGADTNGRALHVSITTSDAWAEQLTPGAGNHLKDGILFLFRRSGVPKTGVRAAIDQRSPPTAPFFDPAPTGWAAYFGGNMPFGQLDPTNQDDPAADPVVVASGTEASGTAYGAFGTVDMHADGLQPGLRCTVPLHLMSAPTMFVVVTVDGC